MLLLCLPLALAAEPAPTVARAAEAPTYAIAGGAGTARLLLNASQGAPAAVSHLVLAPGAEVPPHRHDSSAELLYVETGQVTMVIGGQTWTAGPGDAILIPAGVEHSARVLGKIQPLEAVQIYVGPGPEQRFTQGPPAKEE